MCARACGLTAGGGRAGGSGQRSSRGDLACAHRGGTRRRGCRGEDSGSGGVIGRDTGTCRGKMATRCEAWQAINASAIGRLDRWGRHSGRHRLVCLTQFHMIDEQGAAKGDSFKRVVVPRRHKLVSLSQGRIKILPRHAQRGEGGKIFRLYDATYLRPKPATQHGAR